jgi:photosystem II stability/assembly factor-like uncharacterized protein
MMLLSRIPVRGIVVVLTLAVGLGTSFSHGQDKTRDQQLADLEKEIQALHKKLDDLRAATPPGPDGTIPADWIKSFSWRCIGPANMGGRITAISVFEADPSTYWVATASGGLVKTTNNGITFQHQFDHEATVSIGDVCVAPSDRNIVWVGTGEANPRNSVSYGDGVYKSTDSGKTWKNMGLKKSYQIGRIAIHPTNPSIVYVGALGRCYGPNEERGLFKTTNGGDTWEKVLYVDDKTGVIDVQMSPADPETLLVATWERQRDEFDDFLGEPPPPEGIERYDPVRKYGKGGGVYKTSDGGKSFRKLAAGLPTVATGRIGLSFSRKNPSVVFAIADTEKIGTGLPPLEVGLGADWTEAAGAVKLADVGPRGAAGKAGLKADDVLVSVDGKAVTNTGSLIDILRPHKVGDQVKLAYQRGTDKKEVELKLAAPTAAGGPSFVSPGFFADDAEGGVVVTSMVEGGSAMKAGLQYDDIITAIDGQPVEKFFTTLGKIMSTHKAGDKIKVQVVRGTEKKEIEVTLERTSFGRMASKPIPGRIKRPNSQGFGSQNENLQEQQGPDGFQTGGVYKSTDAGETWQRVNSFNPRPMYFSQIRADPTDEQKVYVIGFEVYSSKDGGRRFKAAGNQGVHSDQHALWIDPKDGRHMLLGTDGGFYQTYDRAEHWDHLNHLALGQFYHVAVDSRPLYRACGGLQDNGSWAGPAHSLRGSGPVNDDWLFLSDGDGFVCRVDQNDPDLVYSESQNGFMQRKHLKKGEQTSIHPPRVAGQPEHRFNWNTPFILSSHDSNIFYCAGEYVWRSVKRGDNLRVISPEITRTKHGSATALAESPKNPEVLYVGTDDGNLWITRDGGTKWTNIADKVGLPGPRWVASIEPSRYEEGRAYVAFDAHRSNDDEPYVFVTEDYGQSWKPLRSNLPTGSSRVCREDIQNQNLLYVGTEFAAWVSINRGASWTKLNNNLPTVAVHEFAQHPTAGEVVVATHGRSLWVLDVTPLRQMTAEALKDKVHLYQPNHVVRWQKEPGREEWFGESNRRFVGQNAPPGAQIYYALGAKANAISLKVLNYKGDVVSELKAAPEPGLHKVAWNLMQQPPRPAKPASAPAAAAKPAEHAEAGAEKKPAAPEQKQAAEQKAAPPAETEEEPAPEFLAFFGGRTGQVSPGMYRVVLTVDGVEKTQWLRVNPDPNQPVTTTTTEEGEQKP